MRTGTLKIGHFTKISQRTSELITRSIGMMSTLDIIDGVLVTHTLHMRCVCTHIYLLDSVISDFFLIG